MPEPRPGEPAAGPDAFPLGAAVALADLDADPHPVLAGLRAREPVSWLPALGGWLVTSRELALRVLRDSAVFTVDDPRFSTARVVGPSMLSLDGAEHSRHRGPFTYGFSHREVRSRLAGYVTAEADRLVNGLRLAGTADRPLAGTAGVRLAGTADRPLAGTAGVRLAGTADRPLAGTAGVRLAGTADRPLAGTAGVRLAGTADLRPGLAAPLAAAVMAQALGLSQADPGTLLAWYGAIVAAVSDLAGAPGSPVSPAGAGAFRLLDASLREVIGAAGRGRSLLADAAHGAMAGTGAARAAAGDLSAGEVVSNAAVLLFGGIETTEGMISNVILHLLSHPAQLALVRADPGLIPAAVEESLRLEPAAAVVDRYATRDTRIGAAAIRRGDLVTVSLAGAGRDPAVFEAPDSFDVRRPNARAHLAFAHGPHFCLGADLARLEAQAALRAVLRLPGLRLDPDRPSSPRGLVFRKPPSLHIRWDTGGRP